MPFNVRSISVSIAVACFFAVAIVGWINGLSPFICSKRAMAAAVFGYVAGMFVVKLINIIVINAMVESCINKQKENKVAGGN